jgi:hypothetical protein
LRANYGYWPRAEAVLPDWLKCGFSAINDRGANVVLPVAMPAL